MTSVIFCSYYSPVSPREAFQCLYKSFDAYALNISGINIIFTGPVRRSGFAIMTSRTGFADKLRSVSGAEGKPPPKRYESSINLI